MWTAGADCRLHAREIAQEPCLQGIARSFIKNAKSNRILDTLIYIDYRLKKSSLLSPYLFMGLCLVFGCTERIFGFWSWVFPSRRFTAVWFMDFRVLGFSGINLAVIKIIRTDFIIELQFPLFQPSPKRHQNSHPIWTLETWKKKDLRFS